MKVLKTFLPVLLATASGIPLCSATLMAQQWTAPTPEELSMTSIKEVPGAAAVYLNKDEVTDDSLHMHSFYYRLKVLTEKGKDYANVELPYYAGDGGTSITDISGRTIHQDGTIIEFSGKPYEKLIVKAGDSKVKAKVFTLPSVDVGSIIEYRYKQRLEDNYYMEPQWYIQSELYTRKAHYMWRPTERDLVNDKGELISGAIAWSPILPKGVEIQQSKVMTGGNQLELNVHDIAPIATEEYMPPMQSLSYRVLFYYTPYHTMEEFWTSTGKRWSKETDKFVGPSRKVSEYANGLVLPADTNDQKVRKLYSAVMAMENSDFTRERTKRENKSEGFRDLKSSEDIMTRKRGSSQQLTELFVGMARSVGLKAYVMGISDRNERLFLKGYLSLRQLDDEVAIVSIDGKDVFFDPGERYCEAEHLSWPHAGVGGLRQTDGGTALAATPGESYKTAHSTRLADLKVDEHGVAEGTVTLAYMGDPALRWRHVALTGDETKLNDELKTMMERMLPGGMEVKVTGVDNLTDPDKPLSVKYDIKGAVGSSTGKRLLLPADIFVVNERPRFSEPKREIPIDMHYASYDQDAVRFKLPEDVTVESAPDPEKEKLLEVAVFDIKSVKAARSITSFRNLTLGQPLFFPSEYEALKSFYGKLEAKDQETIVLTRSAVAVTAAPGVTKPGS